MDRDKQREIAGRGGRAAHLKGTAHRWSEEEAKEAGRKGGAASHRNGHRPVSPSKVEADGLKTEEVPADDEPSDAAMTDAETTRNGG